MNILKNRELAKKIIENSNNNSFVIKSGVGNLMFSAPHCVFQTRNGNLKYPEPESGELVEMLHNEYNCPIIRKVSNYNDDANYDEISDYKYSLIKYIKEYNVKILIDLHQLAIKRDEIICLGTNNFQNINNDKDLLNKFLSIFSRNKLGIIQIDKPFDSSYEYTISSTVHRECKIPCLQLEVNAKLVRTDDFYLVYKALSECFLELKDFDTLDLDS
jgi:hypothetical protein